MKNKLLSVMLIFLFCVSISYNAQVVNANDDAISLPDSGLDIANGTIEILNSNTISQNGINYTISASQTVLISGTNSNNSNIKIKDDVGTVHLLLSNSQINVKDINAIDVGRNNNIEITIQDGSNNILSGNYAVYAGINSSLTFYGNGSLDCTGNLEAIYAKVDININGGKITAKSADVIDSVAICAIHTVNISGSGTVVNGEGYEDAIYAGNSIQIDSAKLNLTATHDDYKDGSVHCYFGDIKIKQAQLKATCRDDKTCYGGISARNGSISIENSNVESFGKKFALSSKNGIYLAEKGYDFFEGDQYGLDKSTYNESILSDDKTHTNKNYIAIAPKLCTVEFNTKDLQTEKATISYGDTCLSISNVPNKEGHTLSGFYTDDTCKTMVADAAGNLIANVAEYTDSNAKWISENDSVTLYVQFEKNININLIIGVVVAIICVLGVFLFKYVYSKKKSAKN